MKRFLIPCIGFILILTFFFFYYQQGGATPIIKESAITPNQKLQCISYSPFINEEGPWQLGHGLTIPIERIDADLKILSERFSCVRIYSVTGLAELPSIARKYNLKVLLGGWVNGDSVATKKELSDLIAIANANRDVVEAILVGNETLLRKEVTPAQLINYIHEVKSQVGDLPVTYADVWEFWLHYPEVALAVDYLTIHILPYWEDKPIAIDDGMAHVQEIYEKIQKKFPGKEIFIGETGWPSEGRMRKGALPSLVNEARYIRGFIQLANQKGWRYNLIEAFDQPWKQSEGVVGGHWGAFDTNRMDKNILSGNVVNNPNWQKDFFTSCFFIFGFLLVISGMKSMPSPVWFLTLFGLVFYTLLNLAGFIFEARYRSFPYRDFFLPILATCFIQGKIIDQAASALLRLWGYLLAIGSAFVFVNETPLNWQSNLWVAECVVLAIVCLQKTSINCHSHERGNPVFFNHLWVSAFVGMTMILALLIRYQLMEPATISNMCVDSPINFLCRIRSAIGFLIYLQIFPKLGLFFTVLSLLKPNRILIVLGMCLGIVGMVLYHVDLGVWAFLIGTVALMLRRSPNSI